MIKKLSWFFFGNLINRAIPVVLIPILTRLLTPSEYGTIAIILAYVTIISPCVGLSLNSILNSDYFKYSNEAKGRFISSIYSVLLTNYTIAILISITIIIANNQRDLTILYALLISTFAMINLIYLTILQLEGAAKKYFTYISSVAIFSGVISIMFVDVFELGWHGRIQGVILGALFGSVLLVPSIFKYKEYLYIRNLSSDMIKKIYVKGVTLMPHSLAGIGMLTIDRFVIDEKMGSNILGVYAVALSIVAGLELINTSIAQIWQPKYLKYISGKELLISKVYSLLFKYLSFTVIIIFLAVKILVYIYPMLVSDEFIIDPLIIYLLAFSSIIQVLLSPVYLFLLNSNKTNILSIASAFSLAINLFACLVLVDRFGLYGAPLSTLVAQFCVVMILFIVYILQKRNIKLYSGTK